MIVNNYFVQLYKHPTQPGSRALCRHWIFTTRHWLMALPNMPRKEKLKLRKRSWRKQMHSDEWMIAMVVCLEFCCRAVPVIWWSQAMGFCSLGLLVFGGLRHTVLGIEEFDNRTIVDNLLQPWSICLWAVRALQMILHTCYDAVLVLSSGSVWLMEFVKWALWVGRVPKLSYSLGRSGVECIWLGGYWWITNTMVSFFFSVVAGFSESIFVRTICWTSLKHVSMVRQRLVK